MLLDRISRSPSKTLASILAMFCFGVAIGRFVPVIETLLGLGLVVVPLALGLVSRQRRTRMLWFLIASLVFGIFRIHQGVLPDQVVTVADRVGVATRVEGVIRSEVESRIGHQRVVLDEIFIADEPVEGKLLARLPLYPEVAYNDKLVFNCTLETPAPFNGFAYDRFLATRGIYAICNFPQFMDVRESDSWSLVGSILSIKIKMLDHLGLILHEPHAAFLSGLLFGGNSSLSSDLKNDFAATGTSHILAASGFNVSLFSLVFLSWILGTRIRRKNGLLLTLALIFVYVITAGATPSVVRAGIMGGLILARRWISRSSHTTNLLLLTATVMLLVNPLLLADDVGFQLSFVATAAVLMLTKPIQKRLTFIPKRFAIRESFAASLGAIAITLPILLWHFGEISLVAPITNLLILPLVPYAMAMTIIALTVSFISINLAVLVALPAWALSTVMIWIIRVFGAIQIATISPVQSQILAVGVGALIASIIVYVKTHHSR